MNGKKEKKSVSLESSTKITSRETTLRSVESGLNLIKLYQCNSKMSVAVVSGCYLCFQTLAEYGNTNYPRARSKLFSALAKFC